MKATKIKAPNIIAGSFLIVIIIGTVLLSLPFSTTSPGSMLIIDALFTSTSAVCVTGLIVVDTGTFFTGFGQFVIMLLFQIGGLGIMTLSTFFLIVLGKRLQMKDLFVIEGTMGKHVVYEAKNLVKYIFLSTLGLELVGATILAWRFNSYCGYSLGKAIYHGIFHSVSAFCNAGFSLYHDSLTRFGSDGVIIGTMGMLIILGGLGFLVLLNINTFKFWQKNRIERGRIKLQTKIVISVSMVLLVFAFFGFLVLEWSQTLNGMGFKDKILNSIFHSITPRTAGFNTVSVVNLSLPTLCLMLFLMFVGASPGSTGGGIKTSTFMVLLANARSIIKGDTEVHLFNRAIPKRIIQEATCIVAISIGFIFLFTMGLLITDGFHIQKNAFIKTVFEVMSAFANVGLSTGITSSLSSLGKMIIIVTMFIGRISPLAMAVLVGRGKEKADIGYPTETVMVG